MTEANDYFYVEPFVDKDKERIAELEAIMEAIMEVIIEEREERTLGQVLEHISKLCGLNAGEQARKEECDVPNNL